MKRVIRYFGICIIIILMTAAAVTFLARYCGWRVDAVLSGSMEPQLKVGGLIITRPLESKDIRIGDTITFYSPLSKEMISHRVIAVEDGPPIIFRTKGDANKDADPFVVPAENIVGRICFHLPYFGYATQFVKTPLGLLLTICLPGLVIIVLEIMKIWHVLTEREIKGKYTVR